MNLTNTDFEFELPAPGIVPSWADTLIQVLYGFVFVVGLIGNSLVIYVVVRLPKMNTVTNFYILNLAIADLCFILGLPFVIIYETLQYWPFWHFMCNVCNGVIPLTYISSSFFLLVIAADRYILVCRPALGSRCRTLRNAKITAAAAWLLAVISVLHMIAYSEVTVYGRKINDQWEKLYLCQINWTDSKAFLKIGSTATILYYFSAGFAIPMALILIFHLRIVQQIKLTKSAPVGHVITQHCQQQPHTLNAKDCKVKNRTGNKNVTKFVYIVIATFFLCWGPYWIFTLVVHFSMNDISETVRLIYWFSECLCFANSALNPILYAFVSSSFRNSFKQVCSCISENKSCSGGTDNTGETLSQEKNDVQNVLEMITI